MYDTLDKAMFDYEPLGDNPDWHGFIRRVWVRQNLAKTPGRVTDLQDGFRAGFEAGRRREQAVSLSMNDIELIREMAKKYRSENNKEDNE